MGSAVTPNTSRTLRTFQSDDYFRSPIHPFAPRVRHFATTFDASGEEAGNLLHKRPWPQQLLAENHGIFNGHTGTLSKMWRHRVNGIAINKTRPRFHFSQKIVSNGRYTTPSLSVIVSRISATDH